jgi:hypothetical protein
MEWHDCWARGGVRKLASRQHCEVIDRDCSYFSDWENVDRNLRLGTIDFDMVGCVDAYQSSADDRIIVKAFGT